MNKTEIEIRKKYRYMNLSYVFDVYMECEFRANLTSEEYDGLGPGEFRFDYKSWAYRLGITKKQMERAVKELTTENIVIIQIEKGTKGTSSKYLLARFKENNFEEKKKEHNKDSIKRTIGEEKSIVNTKVDECVGEQKGDKKERLEGKKKEQSSQHNNLNIISIIYSHWNSKKIIIHKSLNDDIEKAIEKSLKKYSENEIIQAIDIYSEILKSDFYFNYKWSLTDLLNRKNGISTFMEDGSNKANYNEYLAKKSKGKNDATKNSNEVHLRGWG